MLVPSAIEKINEALDSENEESLEEIYALVLYHLGVKADCFEGKSSYQEIINWHKKQEKGRVEVPLVEYYNYLAHNMRMWGYKYESERFKVYRTCQRRFNRH